MPPPRKAAARPASGGKKAPPAPPASSLGAVLRSVGIALVGVLVALVGGTEWAGLGVALVAIGAIAAWINSVAPLPSASDHRILESAKPPDLMVKAKVPFVAGPQNPFEFIPVAGTRPAMMPLEGGLFVMGASPEDAEEAATAFAGEYDPRVAERMHDALIAPFWMSVTHVTQAQYHAVTGKQPAYFGPELGGQGNCPVEQVTYQAAVEYCNALSKLEGLTSAYVLDGELPLRIPGASGYRLPTEAEWELAARAGSVTRFWCGDSEEGLLAVAWCAENSESRSHPVADKPANGWGLHDVIGNVCVWCEDWYDEYPEEAPPNYGGPPTGSVRVVRGGSWAHPALLLRVAFRSFRAPDAMEPYLGFRIVRPAPASAQKGADLTAAGGLRRGGEGPPAGA